MSSRAALALSGLRHRIPAFFAGKQPKSSVSHLVSQVLSHGEEPRGLLPVRAGVGRYGSVLAGSWNFAELSDRNRLGFLPLSLYIFTESFQNILSIHPLVFFPYLME